MVKRLLSGISAFILSVSSLFVFAPMIASAATDACTWTGTTNSNWNTAANWNCATDGTAVPDAGDTLVFSYGAGVTNKTLTNDIAADTSFASITFVGTASSNETSYTLGGNAIALTTGISNTSTGAYGTTINLAITVSSAFAINATNAISFGTSSVTDKTIAFGGNAVTITGSSDLKFYGPVTGSAAISSTAPIAFYANNPGYTGTLTTTSYSTRLETATFGGTIVLNGSAALTAYICDGETLTTNITVNSAADDNASQLVISHTTCPEPSGGGFGGSDCDNATSFIPCDVTATEYFNGGYLPTTGSVTLAGSLTLGVDTVIQTYAKNLAITSTLSGSHTLSLLTGANGILTLNSANNTSSTANGVINPTRKTTTIAAGNESSAVVAIYGFSNYILDGKRGDIYVQDGGILSGTGTAGKVKIDADSFIAPGKSPGCLNTGDLTEGGTYSAEIGGTTACTTFDQLRVTGTVNVTNGVLSTTFVNGFKAKAKDSFMLIDNDAADAVTGTFKDMAEGATFKLDGYVLKITYKGGNGNDVVLSVVSIPGTPDTGFGLLFNNPAALLATTTLAAFGVLMISRRLAPKKIRR